MASIEASIPLSFEVIDDLIYSARSGDMEALKTDISRTCQEYNCSASSVLEAAIDTEDESEGGTGACLLHWPAANGNIEILKYLLDILRTNTNSLPVSGLINHRNHSGNTPLHWAALNTHLDCVKALVEAGADIDLKNNSGHDAAYLAERSEWGTAPEDECETNEQETEATPATSDHPMSKALQVVEYLLTCDRATQEDQDNPESGSTKEDSEEMKGINEE